MWVSVTARGILRPGVWVRAHSQARGSLWGSARGSSSRGGEAEAEAEAEPGVEEIIRAEKRKLKAIKFRRIQAQMGLSGSPPRSLTTEAMEQIRFLKTKFPEEWSVSQLAEGFSVNEDVIRRVLKSKFKPSVQRRMRQDANVCGSRQTVPHGAKRLTANSPDAQALVEPKLLTHPALSARLPQGTVADPSQSDFSGRLHNPVAKETGRINLAQQSVRKEFRVQSSPDLVKTRAAYAEREECSSSDEEQLPGFQETDEELQKLTENQLKVVQKGSEFYDQEGNFLYRFHNTDS